MNNFWMMLRTHRYEMFILILSLVVTREWFLPGLPSAHDPEVHITRAAAIAKSLLEGNILPRWAGYFNSGFGSPSIMFLYPAVPYISAFVHLVTQIGFIDIYKYLLIASYAASGIFWFVWMKKIKFTAQAALIGSVYYLLAPYHLVDVFVRGALAENIGFMFFPLIFFAADGALVQGGSKKNLLFALTISGVILSHNLSALMFFPLIILCPLPYVLFERERMLSNLKTYYFSIFLGLSLGAFFWIPSLMESRYTLASWVFYTKEWYAEHFVYFHQLLWSPWGYGLSSSGDNDGMTFQIGVGHWFVTLLTSVIIAWQLVHKHSSSVKTNVAFYGMGFTLFFSGLFFSNSISNFIWRNVSLLSKFQFPWRFLIFVVIGTSIFATISAKIVGNSKFIFLLVLLPIIFTANYWHVPPPSPMTEQYLAVDYRGTSDTGETSPIWAVRYQDYLPKAPVEIVSSDGVVEIDRIEKRMQEHTFRVRATAQSQIVDNTLYFPGWKVFVDDRETPVVYEDQNWRGLMTFPVTQGEHRVRVVFGETTLRKFADAISIIAAGILIVLLKLKVGGDNATASTS